jgi:RNase H-fold protein (predicted Holliday junction resolvase)
MIKLSSVVTPPLYLGFDPGKDKCGLALVDSQNTIHWHQVIPTEQVTATLKTICKITDQTGGQSLDETGETISIDCIILGDQTQSKYWKNVLQTTLPNLKIVTIDERYSSLEARSRYWEMYPPSLWQRLIPQGLRQPPRPVDDIVAIVLVERYLGKLESPQV